MSDKLHVRTMTVHDCAQVEIAVDHVSGCIQISCSDQSRWPDKFTLLLFGLDDTPPELMPTTYIDPPRDEDEDEEKVLDYADKHGA